MHSHRRIEGLPLQRRGDGDHEEEEEHHSKDSKFKYRTLWNFLVFFAFVFVVVPVVVVIFSFFFGFILAEAEGWSNMNGFYYVTSMLCGLPTPLTDVTPASDEGKFVDIVIAVWSWALIGTVIGIIGGLSIMSDLVAAVEGIGMKLFKSSPLSRQRVAASPAEEVKTGAGEQAERDNLENVGKGDANVGVQMAALAERITVLESLITKQTTMLDTLFATSQA